MVLSNWFFFGDFLSNVPAPSTSCLRSMLPPSSSPPTFTMSSAPPPPSLLVLSHGLCVVLSPTSDNVHGGGCGYLSIAFVTSYFITPRCPFNCCVLTHFGENQIALGLSGISPLTTTHPLDSSTSIVFVLFFTRVLTVKTIEKQRSRQQERRRRRGNDSK